MSAVTAVLGNVFLFFLIFGLSVTVDFSHFREQIKNVKAISIGCFLQFIALPAIGFAVVKMLNLNFEYGIALLIITASPGGAYSNWFCSLFNGDLALSVTMTAISTVISMGMLPFNVFVYSKLAYDGDVLDSLDWNALGISLAVVISAISLGVLISAKCKTPTLSKYSNTIGNLSGLGLIILSGIEGDATSIFGRPITFYLASVLPLALGMFCSIILSSLLRLKKPERIAVTVECVYQNTGIAITSCFVIFSGDQQARALGVPFFYTGMQTAFVGVFCLIAWKMGWSKAPKDDNIFKVIVQNYQGEDENDSNGIKEDKEKTDKENQKVSDANTDGEKVIP